MKKFSKQFYNKSQTVKLRAAEQRELRERVVSYMEYHPLPENLRSTKPVANAVKSVVAIPYALLARGAAVMAVMVLMVVPVLAERAVPGDGLYAIKVRFNEEVRSSLTFSSTEKIEWETERLNRRIAEAKLLANEGRLSGEVEAEVVEAIKTQTANVNNEIAILRETDEDEATIASLTLNTNLAVQSASLKGEGDGDMAMMAVAMTTEEDSPTKRLASALDQTISEQTAATASSSLPQYPKLISRVEINTTRAYELKESLKLNPEDQQYKDINRRLDDINRSIAEAVALREQDEVAAREQLVDVLARTQKLIIFMTDITVANEVEVETLVPVVLTPEEKTAKIDQYQTEIQSRLDTIEEQRSTTSDSVRQEIDTNVSTIISLQARIDTSTDLVQIVAWSEEALMLAEQILQLIANNQEEVEDPQPEVDNEPEQEEVNTPTTRPTSTTGILNALFRN